MTEIPSTPDPVDSLLAPEQPVVDSAPAPVANESVVTPDAGVPSEDAPLEQAPETEAEEVPADELGVHIAYI